MSNRNRQILFYDAVIIGSGFGGSLAAYALVNAGLRVLMIERGDGVRRGYHNWLPESTVDLTPYYSSDIPLQVISGGSQPVMGTYSCVGGPSVFYGGVSLRFREEDFRAAKDIAGDSQAYWPFSYRDLEPFYGKAEQILQVAGKAGQDPCEPFRSSDYRQALPELSPVSRLLDQSARKLGLKPFQLPLAINYSNSGKRQECLRCVTCDTYACAIGAKNDLATLVLPRLLEEGMELQANTIAVRLETGRDRVMAVHCLDKEQGRRKFFRGKMFILAAGALGTPHLLLASQLEKSNPAGEVIGRYLMRHCSSIVFGIFPYRVSGEKQFQKQLGITDYYFGDRNGRSRLTKLGSIQQIQSPPPAALVKKMLPKPLGRIVSWGLENLAGLLTMAEDQPRLENCVTVDKTKIDRWGLPAMLINYRESERDLEASRLLVRKAKRILRLAGAWFFYTHQIKTFSHAVGTVRMGLDPRSSPLDSYCKFRGLENLFVTDGSVFPSSAGVNPSLTIAANSLRVGEYISKTLR